MIFVDVRQLVRQHIGQLGLVIQKRNHTGTDQHGSRRKRMRFGNGINGDLERVKFF